jgi:hypothetical protein
MKEEFIITRVNKETLNVEYKYIPHFDTYQEALEFLQKLPVNYYQINKVFVK